MENTDEVLETIRAIMAEHSMNYAFSEGFFLEGLNFPELFQFNR
jgi:hypothetical protein